MKRAGNVVACALRGYRGPIGQFCAARICNRFFFTSGPFAASTSSTKFFDDADDTKGRSLEEQREIYRRHPKALSRWLDLGIVKKNGRAFEPDRHLLSISAVECIPFPSVPCCTLKGLQTCIPPIVPSSSSGAASAAAICDVRLVHFSFKEYGYELSRPWVRKFREQFANEPRAQVQEICFVEWGFLSVLQSAFVSTLKSQIAPQYHEALGIKFGGVMVS